MEAVPSYREISRARLREALVAAARDLTIARGWPAVRMADVAGTVGVSRQTVYNEFRDRAGLAEALTAGEIQRFVALVRTELFTHGPDVRAAAHAAILSTLREASRNPLVKAILTSGRGGAGELPPYLTTQSAGLLATGSAVIHEWAAACVPSADPAAVSLAAESAIRLTVSHVLLPLESPADSATAVAEVFARLMSPSGVKQGADPRP